MVNSRANRPKMKDWNGEKKAGFAKLAVIASLMWCEGKVREIGRGMFKGWWENR
jgi:hypothetical protein